MARWVGTIFAPSVSLASETKTVDWTVIVEAVTYLDARQLVQDQAGGQYYTVTPEAVAANVPAP